jgi:hypothetical protein
MSLPPNRLIPSALLLIIALISCRWFANKPIWLTILVLFSAISLFIFSHFSKSNKIFLLVLSISLGIVQITSTRLQTTFEYSGYDNWYHQQLKNSYPPKLYRLGGIVETKLEPPLFYRLKQNLFLSLDFTDYFKNFFPAIFFIPFIAGLINYLRRPNHFLNYLLVAVLFLFFLIGPRGIYGPVCFIPWVIFLISHSFEI